MRFVPYQANTEFVISTCHTGISHELHIYSHWGNIVGKISIGDDPDDFNVETVRIGYEPVVNWVAENWRGFHTVPGLYVQSIFDVPILELTYDEE